MLPSPRLQAASCAIGTLEDHSAAASDGSDCGDRHAGQGVGDWLVRRRGEEQFVGFAAVKGKMQINFTKGIPNSRERQGGPIYLGPNSTFFADVAEIGREAIAEVDHGGREPLLSQTAPQRDSRDRKEMFGKLVRIQFVPGVPEFLQSGGGRAKRAADIEAISRSCPATEKRFASRDGAQHHDVGENAAGRFCGVPSRKGHAEVICEVQESTHKPVHPGLGQFAGKGQREEGGNRFASHGGDVAKPARQAAMADRLGRMPVAAEVDSLEGEIGGDQGLMAARDAENGGIVADAGDNVAARSG